MSEERFELGKMPQINVTSCHGDLVIRSWAEPIIRVKGSQIEADIDEDNAQLTLDILSSAKLIVPADSILSLADIDGDLVVKNVNGALHITTVSGDAVLADASNINIDTIHGDLVVKDVEGAVNSGKVFGDAVFRHLGSLTADEVYGDMAVKHIAGAVTINEVMGDLSLRHITGDVTVTRCHRDVAVSYIEGATTLTQVESDLVITAPMGSGTFNANGSIVLKWSADQAIDLVANSDTIINKIEFDKWIEGEGSVTAVNGEDGPSIVLNAKGEIVIQDKSTQTSWENFDFDFDFDFDFSNIREQIDAQISHFTSNIEEKFGPTFSQNIAEKFARQAEAAAAKAEKAAERAAHRAQKQAKRQAQRHTRQEHHAHKSYSATPPPQAASKEEQLKILGMVEKGIISPEEANTLLKALEN